jgi:D-alanyl-D-alanine carboxypeptidase (penicillin-binding protein 5/6)
MKRLLALVLALTLGAAHAQAPQPPEVAARAWLLLDLNTNQVLASKDADVAGEPASLTKLMTAYLVFQALKDKKLTLTQTLPVSERAWRTGMTGASRSYLPLGSQVSVDDLLKGEIVQSGNDATVVLAEGIAGSVEQFVEMMNRQALAFGLKNTTFKNPEGLSAPGHASTARDLAVIAQRLVQDHPDYLRYSVMKDFTYNKIKQGNRNLLLYRDPSVDGLKTGYTDAAGYCLIATSRRSFPNGERRLVSVVLGAASAEARANESQKLLNRAGVEGQGGDRQARQRRAGVRDRAPRRGRQAQDRHHPHRPAGRAARQGPGGRHDQGQQQRRPGGRAAAGRARAGRAGRAAGPCLGRAAAVDPVRSHLPPPGHRPTLAA